MGITAIEAVVLQHAVMLLRPTTSRHRKSRLHARRVARVRTRTARKPALRVLRPCREANQVTGSIWIVMATAWGVSRGGETEWVPRPYGAGYPSMRFAQMRFQIVINQ